MRFLALMYHNLAEMPSKYDVSFGQYERQIKWLVDQGYVVDDCDGLLQKLESMQFPEKYIVITFDDGHRSVLAAEGINQKYNAKATYFITTSNHQDANYLSILEIQKLAQHAHIGSHTVNHPYLTKLSDKALEYELSQSKSWLRKVTGQSIDAISVPYGDVDQRVKRYSKETGYTLLANSVTWWNTPESVRRHGVLNRVAINGTFSMRNFQAIVAMNPRYFVPKRVRSGLANLLPPQVRLAYTRRR